MKTFISTSCWGRISVWVLWGLSLCLDIFLTQEPWSRTECKIATETPTDTHKTSVHHSLGASANPANNATAGYPSPVQPRLPISYKNKNIPHFLNTLTFFLNTHTLNSENVTAISPDMKQGAPVKKFSESMRRRNNEVKRRRLHRQGCRHTSSGARVPFRVVISCWMDLKYSIAACKGECLQ